MLKTYNYSKLSKLDIERLIERNSDMDGSIEKTVNKIMEQVGSEGDSAILELTEKFDGATLSKTYLELNEIEICAAGIIRADQRAIEIAFQNIYKFHSAQAKRERVVETMPGVKCWRENRPIERVGLYIPGGTACLPSTLLMLGVPAMIAGCKQIIVCTPPQSDGRINPNLAYALMLLNIDRVYLAGGAQAIAAMAYGTESIPKVHKIFGPGNQFVTMAKKIAQSKCKVSIDMPAGPSEVLVIAEDSADISFVAADLIAQAEHGVDSQSILVTTSQRILDGIDAELEKQLSELPRKEIAIEALKNSYAIYTDTLQEAIDFSNEYAPEHLILQVDDWEPLSRRVINAGSVFLGHFTPESAGDYASGTNHTLPTSGYAKSHSGVSVDSFVKKITFQTINKTGVEQISNTVERLAHIEGLKGHKYAMSIRKKKVKES